MRRQHACGAAGCFFRGYAGAAGARASQPVIVHGGGPAIYETLGKLGIESRLRERPAGDERSDCSTSWRWCLRAGSTRKSCGESSRTARRRLACPAWTAQLIQAKPVANADEVGLVGDVTEVNAELIEGIVGMGYIPVIAPIGIDEAADSGTTSTRIRRRAPSLRISASSR